MAKDSRQIEQLDFFDKLLREAHLVGTPGSGFGACGEGYFRLSAFNSRPNVEGSGRLRENPVGRYAWAMEGENAEVQMA